VHTLQQVHHHTTEGEAMNIGDAVQVFKALLQGPHSRIDLARKAQCNPKTVGKMLVELKAQEMIYVIDYSDQTDGRNRVKIYALGQGEDAMPKTSQPQQVRSRRSYVRKVQAQKQANIKTTFVGGKGLWQ
jgi:predicted ArsR family transcriptional regulator